MGAVCVLSGKLIVGERATGPAPMVLEGDQAFVAALRATEIELAPAQIPSILDGTPHQQTHPAKIVKLGVGTSLLSLYACTEVIRKHSTATAACAKTYVLRHSFARYPPPMQPLAGT